MRQRGMTGRGYCRGLHPAPRPSDHHLVRRARRSHRRSSTRRNRRRSNTIRRCPSVEGVRRVRAGDQSLRAQYPYHPPAREEQPSGRGRICLGIRRRRLPGPHPRPLPGPPRSRRPPRRGAAPPLQQDARTALPLPANRPNLRPDQGLPNTLYAFRTRCRLTLNKIGGLWIKRSFTQLSLSWSIRRSRFRTAAPPFGVSAESEGAVCQGHRFDLPDVRHKPVAHPLHVFGVAG
jgi:hypothetical protein